MELERIEEWQLNADPAKQDQICNLLAEAFPQYPDRHYYKQVPTFRLLVWQADQLIGHVAVTYRMINAAGEVCSIFGLGDVCVNPQFQNQKIGTKLLQALTSLAQQNQIQFLVLIAGEHDLYLANGFQLVDNICKWNMIIEHESLGIRQRRLPGSVLIKPISNQTWPEGVIDFLGNMF